MCDTLVVVGPDRVLFAKNSDRDPNEAQLLEWIPRARHAPGARLRCTYLDVPQVSETHAALVSRPFWMWGAEMGANEHGVTIGNEAVFTRQPYEKTGLTGMDLVRLALERAANASDAVQTIVDLIAAHGQGGGCGHEHRGFTYHNSFLVADPRRAFVLETAGRQHAIEEVEGARSISNGLTIPHFALAHSDPLRSRVAACDARREITQDRAGSATGPGDLMRILRDHGPHSDMASKAVPNYSMLNGALGAPCVHAGGVIAASQTTASWVAELKPGDCRHWVTGTAAPCVSLFKPVRVDEPLELGPAPTDRFDEGTLWWRHERLHRAVLRDPASLAPLFTPERDALEEAWLANPPLPCEAFRVGDDRCALWTERVQARATFDTRPWYVRRYWDKRNRRAGMEA